MRILVYNIPNTLNYGSMMMAENFMYYYYLKHMNEELEFIIITPEPEETKKRFEEALGYKIKITTIKKFPENKNKIDKLVNTINGKYLIYIIKKYGINLVVALGGDDYSEDYGIIYPLINMLDFLHFEKYNIRVVMLSQTIGPFKSWRVPLFRYLLSKVSLIQVRDRLTYDYLVNRFKLKNVELSSDLAFLPLAKENSNVEISLPDNYITVVPSGLIYRYSNNNDRLSYEHFLVKIIQLIIERYNYNIFLLPHVVTKNDYYSDMLICNDLEINLKRLGISDKVYFLKETLLPYQARKILGKSEFIITGRMHAAISAFEQGVPALSLAYSTKYYGIIGDYFEMSDLIIDVRTHDWYELYELIINKITNMRENRDQIRNKIKQKVNIMQEKALKTFDFL